MNASALTNLEKRLARIRCLSGNQLKMIAAVCMLIDHATKVFYQSAAYRIINPMLAAGQLSDSCLHTIHWIYESVLCGIGAVAFPVFAFAFTEGFSHTRSKGRFLARLLLFALISEFPFDTTFFLGYTEGTPWWPWHQNVFFTFALALCALWLMERIGKIKRKPLAILLQGFTILGACCIAQFVVRGDYYGYGVFLIIITYILRENRICQVLGMLLVKLLFDRYYFPVSFLISLALILLYNGKRGKHSMKMFFYGFYPIHIACIGFINWLVFYLLWGRF